MTREDTVDLVRSIVSIYPNWKPDNLTETVNAWHWSLEDYPAQLVKTALQIYIKTNNTGFAPSVSQLIGCMYEPTKNKGLSEGEAWALVKKAIANGNYGSEEEYAKLPELVQRAVGGSQMIRQWAMCDTEEVNTVIMSNFQRTYKAILSKAEFDNKVPQQLSDVVQGITERLDNRIETHG